MGSPIVALVFHLEVLCGWQYCEGSPHRLQQAHRAEEMGFRMEASEAVGSQGRYPRRGDSKI